MNLLQALTDSLDQTLQGLFCGAPTMLNALLAAAPPPPGFIRQNPYLGYLLTPATCPLPPLPPPNPVAGGQCVGAPYNVTVRTRRPDGSTFDITTASVPGPIEGIFVRWSNIPLDAFAPYPTWFLITPSVASPNPGLTGFGPFLNEPDFQYRTESWIVSIERADGLPDNCGSLPTGITPARPQTFGPFPLPNINIDIPGLGNVNFPVTVRLNPAINIPISGGVHIPVNFTFAPNVVFPVEFNANAYLRFPEMTINAGISFNPNIDISPTINFPGTGGGGGGGCECEDIRTIVFEELDNKFPPSRPNALQSISYGVADSAIIDLPQFCERIRIQLVDVPGNAKTQFGGNAPNVVYAGWYSFGFGGTGGDRQPIHYLEHNLSVPVGCDTFDYTCYYGFSAQVTAFFRQES